MDWLIFDFCDMHIVPKPRGFTSHSSSGQTIHYIYFLHKITNYFAARSSKKYSAISNEFDRENKKGSLPEAQLMFFIIIQTKDTKSTSL